MGPSIGPLCNAMHSLWVKTSHVFLKLSFETFCLSQPTSSVARGRRSTICHHGAPHQSPQTTIHTPATSDFAQPLSKWYKPCVQGTHRRVRGGTRKFILQTRFDRSKFKVFLFVLLFFYFVHCAFHLFSGKGSPGVRERKGGWAKKIENKRASKLLSFQRFRKRETPRERA